MFLRKFISQEDMRIANIFEVLSVIMKEGPITRKEIQRRMGLSWGGISQIAQRLLDLGYIEESKDYGNSSAGRKPFALSVNKNDNFVIGIDVNKAGLYISAVNLSGDKVCSLSSGADISGKDSFLLSIYELTDRMFNEIKKKNILAIGVAMQGRVNSEHGISEDIGIDGWKDVNISTLLNERYDVPAYINHDPECILTASAKINKKDTVLLRIDSGIGMAVMKNGKLITGPGMMEIGRCVTPDGKKISQAVFEGSGAIEALAFTLSNILSLFEIYNVTLCGTYVEEHNGFSEEMTNSMERILGVTIDVSLFDVKNAAYGAALYATEEYLSYIK